MNLNLIKYLSLSAFCAAAAGCASYDNSVQQEVTFYSEDTPAVTVSLNGQVLGETTCSAVLDRAASYTVEFSKPGYLSATYDLAPYADPDTGIAAFVDAVYCPELEVAPVAEAEAVAEVAPAAEPVAEPEVPAEEPEVTPEEPDALEEPDASVEEEPIVEAEPEVEPEVPAEEPVAEPEVAPEEPEAPAEEPAVEEPKAAAEEAAPEVVPAIPEPPVEVAAERTLAEIEAELTELKRLRKLSLISAEEFDKRLTELAGEVNRTY